MGVITLKSHIRRAIEFINKESIYIGLGGQAAWEYEPSGTVEIPTPTPTDGISDPFVFGHIVSKLLVYPDPAGELDYRGYRFNISTEEEAYANAARWVYTSFEFRYDEAPMGTYRKVGIYSDLLLAPETVIKSIYTPVEVQSQGILEYLMHIEPITRSANKIDRAIIILSF